MLGTADRALGALWAFHVEDARARAVPDKEQHTCLGPEQGWAWLHFPLSDARARAFLSRRAQLPEDARELILSGERRVQIHAHGDWIYGVLPDWEIEFSGAGRGVAINPGRLYFALHERQVFTIRRHALQCIDDLRRGFERGDCAESPADMFGQFIDRFIDRSDARLIELTNDLDIIEDKMLSGQADPARLKIGPIRRELSRIHREFLGLRGALGRAVKPASASNPLFANFPAYIQAIEEADHEAADGADRARLLYEEVGALLDSAANKSLRVLTILSTMMMPPTLIVGAFGMNLPGMPFSGDPWGFAWACGLCGIVVLIAYAALKKSGALR